MPLWDVKARYRMRGGGEGERELVHMTYLEAPSASEAVVAAVRQGIATEAHERERRLYLDLIAVDPVYYAYVVDQDYDDEYDLVASDTDPQEVLATAVHAVAARDRRTTHVAINIGDDDGPSERIATVAIEQGNPIVQIISPAYVPPAWRRRYQHEAEVAGITTTFLGVPGWFAGAAPPRPGEPSDPIPPVERTFREQILQSPVRPTEPAPTVPYIDLAESQRQRFAQLDMDAGPRRHADDDEHGSPASQRFANLELNGRRGNPPRLFRAQRVIAKLEKSAAPSFQRGAVVTSPEDVAAGLIDYIGANAHEVFLVLFVNTRNQVIGYSEFTSGDVASVEVHVAGILRAALGAGAAAMVTVHQHPSGDPTPSDADRSLWQRVRGAGELVGVPVLDNLVLGEARIYSEEAAGMVAIPPSVVREAAARSKP